MISLGKSEELDAILEMTRSCGRHMRKNGIDQWDENYPDRERLLNDIQTQTLFAFRENEQVLGIIVLNETQDPEYAEISWLTSESERNLVVHRLAVAPEHQGEGIARKLMDFAENLAKERGYASIRLDTFSQNPRNQRFYEARGYTKLEEVYLSYRDDFPYVCYEFVIA